MFRCEEDSFSLYSLNKRKMLPTASPLLRRVPTAGSGFGLEGFPGLVSLAGVELGIF